MTPIAVIFLVINALALLGLPRHLAPLPLLVGCCYMTVTQSFDLGPIHLTVLRILILVGVVRVVLRGERIGGGLTGMDKLMLLWMGWLIVSSPFFPGDQLPLEFNAGQAFNIGGIYFLMRIFCGNLTDLVAITKLTAWLLLPIAVEMVSEHFTEQNMFSVLGGFLTARDEKFRAQGPFAHAILAGSVGAVCFPLMLGIWHRSRVASVVGMLACLLMVAASNSSGPIMSLAFAILAAGLWRWRHLTRYVVRVIVLGYVGLSMVMNRPAYYIIASIDLTGSSTGWHRARLIEAAIQHLNEWWLAGTNFTRHWMASGVSWSPSHADLTNYYILMGTWAGLPLVLTFMGMIVIGFRVVGRIVAAAGDDLNDAFTTWCLGAALFSHAMTCVAVAYFDQSFIFMFWCLAALSSLHASRVELAEEEGVEESDDEGEFHAREWSVGTGARADCQS